MCRKIRTLDDLADLADQGQSVCWSNQSHTRSTPASVVYRMQAKTVHKFMMDGMYLYTKVEKKPSPWAGKGKYTDNWKEKKPGSNPAFLCASCKSGRLGMEQGPCKTCSVLHA